MRVAVRNRRKGAEGLDLVQATRLAIDEGLDGDDVGNPTFNDVVLRRRASSTITPRSPRGEQAAKSVK